MPLAPTWRSYEGGTYSWCRLDADGKPLAIVRSSPWGWVILYRDHVDGYYKTGDAAMAEADDQIRRAA
jgi:hypothetical protein